MYRPLNFPDTRWAPVEVARAKADAELYSTIRPASIARPEDLIRFVILPVFFTFARELCQAVRDQQYSVGKMQGDLQEFRRALSRELCPYRHTNSSWWESFDQDVRTTIEHSRGWREHLRDRADVAEDRFEITNSGGDRNEVDRRERRQQLLKSYKADTGVRFDARIYRDKEVRVHKPSFIEWKKGTLPDESVITTRIEQFLTARKRPRISEG